MSLDLVLGSHNPSKVEQIRALFECLPVQLYSLSDLGIEGRAGEIGRNIFENALDKAFFAFAQVSDRNMWCIGEDTGLYIDVLNGEPGHRAARWAGDDATTEETMLYTLKRMNGMADRSAQFETVVVILTPEHKRLIFWGKVSGRILTEPRCAPPPKMPYSSIFVPDGHDLSFAEMSTHFENSISHRGMAFKQARAYLSRELARETYPQR
jgi:XTP/dITP diphosphohydrolase